MLVVERTEYGPAHCSSAASIPVTNYFIQRRPYSLHNNSEHDIHSTNICLI